MRPRPRKLALAALQYATPLIFLAVFLAVGVGSPAFLEGANLRNILVQASAGGIVAIGMTFALLAAGIDLSVGAAMFVAAAVAGKLVLAGLPLPLAIAAALLTGLLFGAVNGFCIVRLRVLPFVVTLATLYVGMGLGRGITETRAMNLPDSFRVLGTSTPLGVPSPLLVFLGTLAAAHLVLTRTPFGRQVYAVGNDLETAKKAGIPTHWVLVRVYLISGFCAALGGLVMVAQIGALSQGFGEQQEFLAVATAVLGGTSLFGGRGSVLPGTVLGAILIYTINNALVILRVNVYNYPLITGAVIFFAVLLDSAREKLVRRLERRRIRPE